MEGIGLHGGQQVRLTLKPARAGQGYVFLRTDRDGAPIEVHPRNIVEKMRRTMLQQQGVEVHTVEHVLAALFGLGVDNAIIEVSAPEPPAGDGSALAFMELIDEAGTVELDAERAEYTPRKKIEASAGNASLAMEAGEDGLEIEFELDYGVRHLPRQVVKLRITPEVFRNEIGPARTFCLEEEALALKAAGFGKGASTANTLVVGADGPIDNTLRFADEYARHKVLDLVGDLAVAGLRLNATIRAVRSGHSLNQQLARAIRRQYEEAR